MRPSIRSSLIIFLFSSFASANTAQRIYDAAVSAPSNMGKKGAYNTLYGEVINDASVLGGQLACARVASIVLKQAGVMNRIVDGVASIESALNGRFTKVHSGFQNGDVIIWWKEITRNGRKDSNPSCAGGGDCHVGIYVGGVRNTYQNVGGVISQPGFVPLFTMGLLGWKVKYAYRAK